MIKLSRFFTKDLKSNLTVYDMFDWKMYSTKKCKEDGTIIFQCENFEFPVSYTEHSCYVVASKYFRQAVPNVGYIAPGVPDVTRGRETSLKQVVHRMVAFWARALVDENVLDEENSKVFYDETAYAIIAQILAPNSPQWFNTGLLSTYGIDTAAVNLWRWDPQENKVVPMEFSYLYTQGSACYILGVEDDLLGGSGLMSTLTKETTLFKYGSGVGANWSNIRAEGEPLSAGGKSSGLLSFLRVNDRNAGAIKSGGTTRRAAKMNVLDYDHPEIMDYVLWKSREEDKVSALEKMGYSVDIDGEAYDTVSGQNANNSVRLSDSIMEEVGVQDATFDTRYRISSRVATTYPVAQLWRNINYGAWRCGDPGVQFDDTINSWHTCPYGEDGELNAKHNRINASNPCSEYMFLDDTACNLASIRVTSFYRDGEFDLDGYLHAITLMQLMLEATIHWGCYPDPEIARKSWAFRTTGGGLCDLGTLFMQMDLAYGCEDSCLVTSQLSSILTAQSYIVSANMAEAVGPFDAFSLNRDPMLKVIQKHRQASLDRKLFSQSGLLLNVDQACRADSMWETTYSLGEQFGYRNAQVTCIAPTGTISYALGCFTTSTEPMFSSITLKSLIEGINISLVAAPVQDYLQRCGVQDVKDLTAEQQTVLLDADAIPWQNHLAVMAAIQPFISGAISKTVNLPATTTVETVGEVFYTAWKLGLKAVAIYRDGSKECQPLNNQKKKATENPDDWKYKELLDRYKKCTGDYNVAGGVHHIRPVRVKPEGIRSARVHEAAINGLKLYITVSFYDNGQIGEIYVSSGRQGSLTKGLLDSLSTTISEMLQYGIPPEGVARMYRGQRYEPSGLVTGHPHIKFVDSISDLISKIIDIELGNYDFCQVKPEGYQSSYEKKGEDFSSPTPISNAEKIFGEMCPQCGKEALRRNGSCKVCTQCGSNTGCS